MKTGDQMIGKKQKTLEEKKEQVKNFRPIDDTFFEVLADDIGVCQEMLRIILEDYTESEYNTAIAELQSKAQ